MTQKSHLDNFDLDLYNMIPQAKELLAPVAGVELVTHGSVKNGKLSHPSVWNSFNGFDAYFGIYNGELISPQPAQFWTDEPLLVCTFEEAVRDCWVHDYVLGVHGIPVWNSIKLQPHFELLMAATRGYGKTPEDVVRQRKLKALISLRDAVKTFQQIHTHFILMSDKYKSPILYSNWLIDTHVK